MEISDYISILALMLALISVLYTRWTWSEAKKANEISRLNSLLTLKQHYSDLELREHEKSRAWLDGKSTKVSDGYTEACAVAAAEYQQKYREVSAEVERLKPELLSNET